MAKNKIKNLILIFCILILSNLVSSQIIGGEVLPSGNTTPSWQTVFIYDVNNPSNYREVEVSPDQYRYSFANTKINTDKHDKILFQNSATVKAEILDFKNGFMAGPVEMNLASDNSKYYSCTDCDIFGRMEFREIVQLKEPVQKLYISKIPEFPLIVNVYDECDSYMLKNNSYTKYCEKGCDYNQYQSGIFGKNKISLITDCFIGKRIKSGSREMGLSDSGQQVTYTKIIKRDGAGIVINFYGTKTNDVSRVTDFTPDEYEIYEISDDGIAYNEDGYYAIEWKNLLSGNFNFTYRIKPKSDFYSCEMGISNKSIIKKSLEISLQNFLLLDITNEKFYMDCNFSKDISVQLVKEIDFRKVISPNFKKDKSSIVHLQGDISSTVENLELREYIPISFDVSEISNEGILEESTTEYNVIIWNFSGDEINLKYKATPTELGSFKFITELGGALIEKKEFQVSTFLPNIPRKGNGKGWNHVSPKPYKYVPTVFSKVSEDFPIIREDDNLLVAFYSKILKDKASFDLYKFIYEGNFDRTLDYIKSYNVETDMSSSEKGNMKFEYEVREDYLKDNNYKDIKFYTRKNGFFSPITGGVISSENGIIKYGFESPEPLSDFFIFGEKNKLLFKDKVSLFLEKLFSYLYFIKK